MIATYGEIAFVLTGFLYQAGGIVFEAIRLTLVERLLSSAEFKMDPLVSLYYFAPVCAIMNGITSLVVEVPTMHMSDIYKVGFGVLIANAMVAFLLNVSVVFLVCRYVFIALSALLTDHRLAKPHLSSLPCAASSKTSCLSARRC
jgi:hypothetical protein